MSKTSLQDTARDAIKYKILNGELLAGAPLSEEILAHQLNMSRTPVRQGMQELVVLGLLDRLPGRGVVVSRIDLRHAVEIIEIQHCLVEWAAVKLCSHVADAAAMAVVEDAYARQLMALESGDMATVRLESRRMDVALVAATGNREMEKQIRAISDLLLHAATQALGSASLYRDAVKEHGAILAALGMGRIEGVREAVQSHFVGVRSRLGDYG